MPLPRLKKRRKRKKNEKGKKMISFLTINKYSTKISQVIVVVPKILLIWSMKGEVLAVSGLSMLSHLIDRLMSL